MYLIPIIFDLETTDKLVDRAKIVQLAAVLPTISPSGEMRPVTLFSTYVNPGSPIPAEAQEVHHITDEQVRWAPTARRALQTFAMLLERLEEQMSGTVILGGHNIERYDVPIIKRVLPGVFDTYDTVDTYNCAVRTRGAFEQKLGGLFEEYCGFKPIDAHDAAADCHMCAYILYKMMQDTGKSLRDFTEWLIDPVILDIWPLGKYKGRPCEKVPSSYMRWCRENFSDMQRDIEKTIYHYVGSN